MPDLDRWLAQANPAPLNFTVALARNWRSNPDTIELDVALSREGEAAPSDVRARHAPLASGFPPASSGDQTESTLGPDKDPASSALVSTRRCVSTLLASPLSIPGVDTGR